MSLFSKLSLVPKFSPYGGPYAVGSCDVELAAHDLDAPSPAPEDSNIGTVSFRVFYPCEADMNARPIRWLPSPQKAYLSAYARFLGANSLISEAVSCVDSDRYKQKMETNSLPLVYFLSFSFILQFRLTAMRSSLRHPQSRGNGQ